MKLEKELDYSLIAGLSVQERTLDGAVFEAEPLRLAMSPSQYWQSSMT